MRYEEYKETGYRFCPALPASWNIKSGRFCFEENKKKNTDLTEKTLLQFTYGSIVRKKDQEITKDDESIIAKYTVVQPFDIMVNGLNLNYDFVSQRVGLVCEPGVITSAYLSLRCHDVYDPYYANYMLKALDAQKVFHGMGSGVRLTLGFPEFSKIKFPVPPREEQDQIVRYLDWKVSCINKLIHGYQRQIKLLEERRQTVIDRAITKGVRSDRQMQHIQANWMGDIPNDWRMIPAKRLFIESKARKSADDKPATASQKYGIILQEDYMQREGKRIVIATQGLDDWKHVNPDDFVISLRSFQGGIERSEISGCVTWHYIVLLPQKYASPRYFKWLFKSKSYIKALQGTSEFIRDGQDLRYSNFVKVSLPLISMDEQDEIADYIERETAKIDASIPVFEKQIALLKEYRTRLISDVVTGQMDVRGIVVPEYVPETDEEDEEVDEPLSDAGEESEV